MSEQRRTSRRLQSKNILWLTVIAILFQALPPLAILLFLWKLIPALRKRKRRHMPEANAPRPSMSKRPENADGTSEQRRGKAAAEPQPHKLLRARRIPSGKAVTALGAAIAVVFGTVALSEIIAIYVGARSIFPTPQGVLLSAAFFAAGCALCRRGINKSNKAKRFRKYLALVGTQTSVSLLALARAMSDFPQAVAAELQEMLDNQYFPCGFIDMEKKMLFITDEGFSGEPEEFCRAPEVSGEASAALFEIRSIGEKLSHADMKAKVERIGHIAAKIFALHQADAEEEVNCSLFMRYYLPTAAKILRAYAKLEAQGIEGANISEAKRRIEAIMDQIAEGFEKQLDQLFAGSTMDIKADIAVLEQMLQRDGFSKDGIDLSNLGT